MQVSHRSSLEDYIYPGWCHDLDDRLTSSNSGFDCSSLFCFHLVFFSPFFLLSTFLGFHFFDTPFCILAFLDKTPSDSASSSLSLFHHQLDISVQCASSFFSPRAWPSSPRPHRRTPKSSPGNSPRTATSPGTLASLLSRLPVTSTMP